MITNSLNVNTTPVNCKPPEIVYCRSLFFSLFVQATRAESAFGTVRKPSVWTNSCSRLGLIKVKKPPAETFAFFPLTFPPLFAVSRLALALLAPMGDILSRSCAYLCSPL